MRLFVLLSRIPYPLEKGDKLRAFHQLKALHEKHQVFLCCLNYGKVNPTAEEKLREISTEHRIIQLSYLLLPFYLLFTWLGNKPIQVGFFFQLGAYRNVRAAIHSFKPDHIYVQLLRTAEYVKNLHQIPKTIDYQDAFSANSARREKQAGFLMRRIWKMEKERLRNYENLIFEYFENKTIISIQDQQAIHHPLNKNIVVVPNGVDFSDFYPEDSKKDIDILFTGNMAYPPNVETAVFLVNQVLPEIRKQIPSVNLTVCGANPSGKVLQLAGEGVTVTGWVDDIAAIYRRSRLFAAPMQMGAGLQNKLLEAMACGIPCITSELAANALHQVNHPPFLVGVSIPDYVEKIVRLLTDKDLSGEMSVSGRKYVLENYSWQQAVTPLLEILEKN